VLLLQLLLWVDLLLWVNLLLLLQSGWLLLLCWCSLLLRMLLPLRLQHRQHLAQDDTIQLHFEEAGQAIWPTLLQQPGGVQSNSSSRNHSSSVSDGENISWHELKPLNS
jgi:hypothetical protein